MFSMIRNDQRSITSQNMSHISRLINDNCMSIANWKLRQMIPRSVIPTNQHYIRSLLATLLEAKQKRTFLDLGLSKQQTEEMILSLCIT